MNEDMSTAHQQSTSGRIQVLQKWVSLGKTDLQCPLSGRIFLRKNLAVPQAPKAHTIKWGLLYFGKRNGAHDDFEAIKVCNNANRTPLRFVQMYEHCFPLSHDVLASRGLLLIGKAKKTGLLMCESEHGLKFLVLNSL